MNGENGVYKKKPAARVVFIILGAALLGLGGVFIVLHVVVTVNRYASGMPHYLAAYLCVLAGIAFIYSGFAVIKSALEKEKGGANAAGR